MESRGIVKRTRVAEEVLGRHGKAISQLRVQWSGGVESL